MSDFFVASLVAEPAPLLPRALNSKKNPRESVTLFSRRYTEQWEQAIQWYLNWLKACAEANADHRSLPERLRVAVCSAGARRGLAKRTKDCYGAWAARYGAFVEGEREAMEVTAATRFLTSVVDDEDCAYSTQKQALNALAFFFKQVCGVEDPVFGVKLKKTGARMPVVLSKKETQRLLGSLSLGPSEESEESAKALSKAPETSAESLSKASETSASGKLTNCYGLVARLQYGAGLRRSELVRLRIKDIDLGRGTVTVRGGKGDKDRVTILPARLKKDLAIQIEKARSAWRKDREKGLAGVYIPGALSRMFNRASESFEWYWLFPARSTSIDPESGVKRRHHLHGSVYNEAIKRAARRVGIEKRVTSHALRHSLGYVPPSRVAGYLLRMLPIFWRRARI